MSEAEDDMAYIPDQKITYGEESSDEEYGHAEAAVTFKRIMGGFQLKMPSA